MIKVMLVDDQVMVREGLRRILDDAADMKVVGQAEDIREALEKVAELGPDVVVIEPSVPGMDRLEATERLRRLEVGAEVLLLAPNSPNRCVVRLLRDGACGYVNKGAKSGELIDAIRAAHEGKQTITPDHGKGLEETSGEQHGDQKLLSRLTARELQVTQLLAAGNTNHEIAEQLGLSFKTVNTHRLHILAKLGLRNNAELARFAVRNELVEA